jgi:catechol 2,3-dioxygenase-like lactoylglutathione lyase family enzyme
MLICDDVQDAIRFYCEVLGFQVGGRMDDLDKSGWASLRQAVVKKGWPAGELQVRFYGLQEFEVIDPSGHVLLFGQPTDEPVTAAAKPEA